MTRVTFGRIAYMSIPAPNTFKRVSSRCYCHQDWASLGEGCKGEELSFDVKWEFTSHISM